MFRSVLVLCSCSSVPSGSRQCLCQFFTALSFICPPEFSLGTELKCLVYQVECCWQECCAGNTVKSSMCTGNFIELRHIIHPHTLPVKEHRYRISAVIFDRAGGGICRLYT